MNVPKWMDSVLNFGAGIVAAFIGSEWAEGNEPKEPKEKIAQWLQRELEPDREDVIKELERLGPDGEEILRFFDEINSVHGGVITIEVQPGIARRYTETWIMSRMLEVEPKDREWLYTLWNGLCRQGQRGRAIFLARLSGLDSNWYTQYPRLIINEVGDRIPNIGNALGGIADFLEGLPGGQS